MKITKISFAVGLACLSCQAANAENLEVTRVIDKSNAGSAVSCVVMSDTMPSSSEIATMSSLIELKNLDTGNKEDASITPDERSLCFSNLSFGSRYEILLKKGLKSSNNAVLDKDTSLEISTPDSRSSVRFLSGNIISSNATDKKVAIESINVDKIRVTLFKISDSDLATYDTKLTKNIDGRWELISYLRDHAKYVGDKVVEIKMQPNKKQVSMIDLQYLSPSLTPGIYSLIITMDDFDACDNTLSCLDDFDNNWQSAVLSKSIVISDLGVTAYTRPENIDVAVRSLTTALPVAGAQASLLSGSNEVLQTVTTDKDGYAHFDSKVVGGYASNRPVIVKVTKEKDSYYMDLRSSSLFIDNVSADSSVGPTKYNVYAYTNRNLVRPGEKVYYEALVRDNNLKAADLKLLKLMIYRPDGLLYKEVSLKDPVSGGFDYEFEFDKSANLGQWKFSLGFDAKDILNTITVQVDNFVPSTIEPSFKELKAPVKVGGSVPAHVQYIYDAPAANIDVSGTYTVEPDNHPVEKYKDFYFGPNRSNIDNLRSLYYIDSSKTNDKGDFDVVLSDLQEAAYPQKVNVVLDFIDPNSKILRKKITSKVEYQKSIIGIKTDFNKVDKEYSDFKVIVADQNGKLYKDNVDYTIFKKNVSYEYAFYDGYWHYLSNEYLTPVTTGTLNVAENTSATIEYKFQNGVYVISLTNGSTTTETDFTVGYDYDVNPDKPERFALYTDKKSYKPNETAYLEFDSTYNGYADLMLDAQSKDNLLHFKINKGHNKIPVVVNDKLVKGTFALLTTYSAVENKVLGAQRSLGVTYIDIDKSANVFTITSDLPAQIKPNSGFDVKVHVQGASPDTYLTAALVDKGILSINNAKAPAPEKAIFENKDFSTRIFDAYAYLMRSVQNQGQGYGDENGDGGMSAPSLSSITDHLMSYYSPKVKVDDEGYATIHFDVNDISTTAEFMVSAWSKDKLGSYSKSILVKDQAVSKVVLPNYLYKSDFIKSTFTVNNLTENANTYKFKVQCSGALLCSGEGELKVEPNSTAASPIEVFAKDLGPGYVDISVTADGYSYTTKQEYPVLSPFSKLSESKIVVLTPGEEKIIQFENSYEKDTKAKVVLGKIPVVDTNAMLETILNGYSYSIMDETSAALAAISSLKAMEKSKSTDTKKIEILQSFIDDKVASIQSKIRVDGDIIIMGYDYTDRMYATAYAALLLVQADKAGFNVNKGLLKKLTNVLKEYKNSNYANVSALAMYTLTQMGVNVKSDAIYKFDEYLSNHTTHEIEGMVYYSYIFGMYGDKLRQAEALKLAKNSIKEISRVKKVSYKEVTANNMFNYMKQLWAFMPTAVNTLTHDTVAVIKASMLANNTDDLDTLFLNLNEDKYYSNHSMYQLIDLSNSFSGPVSKSEVAVENNSVKIKNPASTKEPIVATIVADGYVNAGKKDNSLFTFTQEFYDEKGKKLAGAADLNVNDNLIIIDKLELKYNYEGPVTMEHKLPSNTVLVKVLNYEELKSLVKDYKGSYYTDQSVTKGDNAFVTADYLSQYNSKDAKNNTVIVAYVVKAAHKGTSTPLMNSCKLKTGVGTMYNSYDYIRKITVK